MKNEFNNRQSGVTLLEVMVGFVIFTSSLVAVLDFVSGHIYQSRLSTTNLQKIRAAYDWSTAYQRLPDRRLLPAAADESFEVGVSAVPIDSFIQQGEEIVLNHYRYRVGDATNALNWTVIRVD